MKLQLPITATQLKAGDETFAGQPVRNQEEFAFAIINIAGASTKVNESDWLIEYHDGTKEVWTDEQLKANTGYVETTETDEDVRIGDEGETAHIISAQNLIDNPELAEQGVKEGDVIGIPDNGLVNTDSPLIQDPTTTTSEINANEEIKVPEPPKSIE